MAKDDDFRYMDLLHFTQVPGVLQVQAAKFNSVINSFIFE